MGVVFELGPSGPPVVLHTFSGPDGANPFAGVVRDAAGNLYGTTVNGGQYGFGTVFELSPSGSTWTPSVLWSFTGGSDGAYPYGGVILDGSGNLFGTTTTGGAGSGVVFEIPTGATMPTILYTFQGTPADGSQPMSSLVRDPAGNLYGTTFEGGSANCPLGCGTVFVINSAGQYNAIAFQTQIEPSGVVRVGASLFGAINSYTDPAGPGQLFELAYGESPDFPSFADAGGGCTDFDCWLTTPAADSESNLYGTLSEGGVGHGIVYKVDVFGNYSTLHSFTGGSDGGIPLGGLLAGPGYLYGTTQVGGANGVGVIFKLRESS
jgi:uncharacterized repeat protein (TIGR03803 family)